MIKCGEILEMSLRCLCSVLDNITIPADGSTPSVDQVNKVLAIIRNADRYIDIQTVITPPTDHKEETCDTTC